jgi:hypothetical protein
LTRAAASAVRAEPAAEVIGPGDDSVLVVANLRPFSSDQTIRRFSAGTTLAEILETLQPNPVLRRCSHVSIGGDRVPAGLLRRVRPKPGNLVNINTVPAFGGGKKSPLRFILQLVVLAAALVVPGLPALAGPIFAGATLTWGAVAGAAIAPIGPLVINARLPARRRA